MEPVVFRFTTELPDAARGVLLGKRVTTGLTVLLDGNGSSPTPTYPYTGLLDGIIEWCIENIGPIHHDWGILGGTFLFSDPNHAVALRLRFDGAVVEKLKKA